MGYLFVFGAIIASLFCNTAKKSFNKNCPVFFAFVCCVFADIFFVFSSGFKFDFNRDIIIYAVLFAIAYSLAVLFMTFAFRTGSFSFTTLIISYSLLLPTFYGIIFLNDATSWFFYIGLVLLCVATFLISYKKSGNTTETKKPLNFAWLIFVAITFVGNGFCTIFQTAEQEAFNGLYKNEFMIIALTLSAIICLIASLFVERGSIKEGLNSSLIFGSISGVLNGVLNLLVMYSVNYLNASIVFPLISGGGLFITFIVARFFYKEKYTLLQYLGFSVSIVSVVLLNL